MDGEQLRKPPSMQMLRSHWSQVAHRSLVGLASASFVALSFSCGSDRPSDPSASASASIDAKPPWIGIELPAAEVEKAINPSKKPVYNGKTGTIKGTIRITGDAPPEQSWTFPPECGEGAAVYGKLFRVGADGALADALVTVTEYDGFVPPTKPAIDVTIQRCAFNSRTYALTFGQRVDVKNLDGMTSYMPYLDGAPNRAFRVAMPQGNTLEFHPNNPKARYLMRDQMKRPFLLADVFVLSFSTFGVTGLDGRYEIKGIPVGKAKLNTILPTIAKTTGKEIEVVEGETTIDLELRYDAATDKPVPTPEPIFGDRPAPSSNP
jgi:hypothetical protein